MSVILRDIAEATQTSISTVSRILTGGDTANGFSLATQRRIKTAARKLGYEPNLTAQALRLQRSNTIALFARVFTPVYSRITPLIDSRLHACGYWLIYCNSNEDPARETKLLRQAVQRGVDGAIIVPTALNAAQIRKHLGIGFPLVILNHQIAGIGPTVKPDRQQAAELLCQTLHKAGVRRVAVLTGPRSPYGQDPYAQTMERQMKVVARIEGTLLKEAGRDAYHMLMRQPQLQFDAIVCTIPAQALGLLEAIPESSSPMPIIAVTDTIPFMHFLPMPMVCVVIDIAAMAEGCVNVLLSQLENQSAGKTKSIVPPLSLFPSYIEYNKSFAALLQRSEN